MLLDFWISSGENYMFLTLDSKVIVPRHGL